MLFFVKTKRLNFIEIIRFRQYKVLQIKFVSNKTTENVPENWHQKEGGFFGVTTNEVDD